MPNTEMLSVVPSLMSALETAVSNEFHRVYEQVREGTDNEHIKEGWQEAPVQSGIASVRFYAVNNLPAALYYVYGTVPHDIPGAWGRPLPFGIGGRFGDNKFHPGNV